MSDIQQVDRKAALIFVGDLNAHYQEWFGSVSGTDRHGAVYDFSNLFGCIQLINGLTHRLDNCLDLLLTDEPSVVNWFVDPPLKKSDDSSISFTLQLDFCIPIPNILFSHLS